MSAGQPARVRRLDADTRNLIVAAERVGSLEAATFELVKNALSACARRVSVTLDVPTLSVSAVDDGAGIDVETAAWIGVHPGPPAALTVDSGGMGDAAHGMSLWALGTLGRLRVRSRRASADGGSCAVAVSFGVQVAPTSPPGAPWRSRGPGTAVEVSDLFSRVPVRQRAATARGTARSIARLMQRFALARPDVGFVLAERAGGTLLQCAAGEDVGTRVRSALGLPALAACVPVLAAAGAVQVRGAAVWAAGGGRVGAEGVLLSVNGLPCHRCAGASVTVTEVAAPAGLPVPPTAVVLDVACPLDSYRRDMRERRVVVGFAQGAAEMVRLALARAAQSLQQHPAAAAAAAAVTGGATTPSMSAMVPSANLTPTLSSARAALRTPAHVPSALAFVRSFALQEQRGGGTPGAQRGDVLASQRCHDADAPPRAGATPPGRPCSVPRDCDGSRPLSATSHDATTAPALAASPAAHHALHSSPAPLPRLPPSGGPAASVPPATDTAAGRQVTREMLARARVVGQTDRKYIVLASGGELLCVDQHAADERVRLERLEDALSAELAARPDGALPPDADMCGAGGGESESDGEGRTKVRAGGRAARRGDAARDSGVVLACRALSTPVPLSLSADDAATARARSALLRRWGFDVEVMPAAPAGAVGAPPSVLLRAVPVVAGRQLRAGDAARFVRELASAPVVASARPAAVTAALRSRACRGAIMFGDEVSDEEALALVRRLAACRHPFQCAHGRPAVLPLARFSNAVAAL